MSKLVSCFAVVALCSIYLSEAATPKRKINVYTQNNNKFQGDIANVPKHPKKTRNGIKFPQEKWTSAQIPYVISTSGTTAITNPSMVRAAMNTIESQSCVRFVQRTTQTNYLNIIKTADGCYSNVGMSGGPQDVSLQDDTSGTCMVAEIIVHELLHATGLYHEQSRYDRDNYITVNYGNIETGQADQFDIVTLANSDVYNTQYDFQSVMHYDQFAFAKSRGLVTIQAKSPNTQYQATMGNVLKPSAIDMTKIRRIYGCDNTPVVTQPPVVVRTNPPTVCTDNVPISICTTFSFFCRSDNFMMTNCRKSCRICV